MIIRKAKIEDSESVTTLLMLATGEVIYKFIGGQDYSKAFNFLLHFVQNEDNQYSYQNCYVAVEKDEIVGAVLAYDGAKLEELRKPVLKYIHRHFDAQLAVEAETQAGEFYLDSLGILPTHQGKGIGSQLIQFIITEKSMKKGMTLGLLVDKTNPGAKKLYLKLGFMPVGEKTLMGISVEHLQISR